MVFLLIGGLAVAADLTTLDASWILPIVLIAAGVSGLALITARTRSSSASSSEASGTDPQ